MSTGTHTAPAPALRALLAGIWTALAGLLASCGEGESIFFPEATSLERVSEEVQQGKVAERVEDSPAVRARDIRGNPVAGVPVYFELPLGEGSLDRNVVVTNDRGIARVGEWVLGERRRLNIVVARLREDPLPDDPDPIEFRVFPTSAEPSYIQPGLGGSLLEARVGEPLPFDFTIRVRDRFGNPVPQIPVEFEVTSGGGTIEVTEGVTNFGGMVSAGRWRLGLDLGPQTVEVRAAGIPPDTIEAIALAAAPESRNLVKVPSPEAEAGAVLDTPIIVEVKDVHGNPVGQASVRVEVRQGDGRVVPEEGTTNEQGRFEVTLWELGSRPGKQTLELQVSGLEPAEIEVMTFSGPPHRFRLVEGHGQAALPGQHLPHPPRVRLVDRFDNPLPDQPVTFHVIEGGGELEGAGTVTDSEGVAAASSWRVGQEPGPNAVEARFAAEEGSDREPVPPFRFEAEAVGQEVLKAAPAAGEDQEFAAGFPLPDPPAVRVTDPRGDPVHGVPVIFEVLSGEGEVSPLETSTDEDGIARVQAWRTGPDPGENLLLVRPRGAQAVTFRAEGIPFFLLDVGAVRMNQGNQTPSGSVQLLDRRAGVLRIFPRATEENALSPAARIRLLHGGSTVLDTIVERTSVGIPTELSLGDVTSSFNVPVPADLVRPGLGIRVELDPYGDVEGIPDRDLLVFPGPGATHSLQVRPTATFRATFVPVTSTELGTTGRIASSNLHQYLDTTVQLLPIGPADWSIRAPYTTSAGPLSGADALTGWSELIQELQALRMVEAPSRYYHGIVRTSGGASPAGLAYRPPTPASELRTALSHDQLPGASRTIAHEFGHNFGRRHAPCGTTVGIDTDYPYPNALIGSPGFDPRTGEAKEAALHRDIMSYCSPTWISDYTYLRMLEWREAASRSGPALVSAAPSEGILVWGGWSRDGAELNPVFHVEAPPSPLPSGAGGSSPDLSGTPADEAEVVGLDEEGRVLFSRPVEGGALGHGVHESVRHFAAVVPLDAQEREALRSVILSTPFGDARRDVPSPPVGGPARAPGELPGPALSATSSTGDRVTVEWDATSYPIALIRDPEDGTILSLARHGRIDMAVPASERIEVQLGEGVRVRREELRLR